MGRYYSGNIEGKFWFGVQASDSADRFGVTGFQPSYLEYYFGDNDLELVEKELQSIEEKLGNQLNLMNEFFSKNNSYSDDMLTENGIDFSLLREYADYILGCKIRDAIKEDGYCEFDAEL